MADDRSFLDVGIAETQNDEGLSCEVLSPRTGKRAASQPWAPLDFYSNVLSPKSQAAHKSQGTLGEPDIFFCNDDHNRNNKADAHTWTRVVADHFKGSLAFTKGKKSDDWLSFEIEFTRGKLSFSGLLGIRTWLKHGACTAAAFLCTKEFSDATGDLNCEKDGWTRVLREVVATADPIGAGEDYLKSKVFTLQEKDKNDVKAVRAVFSSPDGTGIEEEVLARK